MKADVKVSGSRVEITRVFDAPRAAVFGWWTEAGKLAQWSGCKDAVRCEIEMDFRVGGSFTQKMHLAGKGEFVLTGTYEEIVVPEKIAYHAEIGGAMTRVTIRFFEEGTATKVVLTHEGFPNEMFSKFVSEGTAQSFDKLEAVLAGRAAVSRG